AHVALHDSASNQVASASPMPATRSLTGEFAMILVSTRTMSGLRRSAMTRFILPVSLRYTMDRALHGASVEATVGTITTGTSIMCATALAVSSVLPPPRPTMTSHELSPAIAV